MMAQTTLNLIKLVTALVLSTVCYCDGKRKADYLTSELQRELNDIQQRLDEAFVGSCGDFGREAEEWIYKTDKELGRLLGIESLASWNYITNLTDENSRKLESVAAETDDWMWIQTEKAHELLRNADQICNATAVRLLRLLTQFSSVPIPRNIETRRQLTHLANEMQEIYAMTNVTRGGKTYRLYPDLADIMSNSRDSDELLWAWGAWHNTTGRKLKKRYTEFVEKMNEAARDNGYPDIGYYWKLSDFDQENIESVMDKLYEELLPFYEQLHAYVRKKLAKVYKGIDRKGYLPAHLLGNMWAQEWEQIEDILLPFPNASSNYDVTKVMVDQGYTQDRMFRLAEQFFVSIGLEPMTSDFWKKSVIVRPEDNRPLECHASAEEFFSQTDFRIKMCTEVTASDLQIVHHEMGHIEYFMQYRHQPTLFRTGANAAFHEAIGDTIALSVMTNKHLTAIGLSPTETVQFTSTDLYEQEINFLMRTALLKIAFIPFGYVVDKWRYKVFRGDIVPENYTSSWWKLREYYEGIAAPVSRSTDDFDPGAKYHVPANVPYSRYFFSFIGQFQFQSTLCKLAGHKGPLHKCDIYKSKKAGDRLRSVLSLGASRPWPEVMKAFTGDSSFTVDAILEFFQPLIDWLKKDNKGESIGWKKRRSSYRSVKATRP